MWERPLQEKFPKAKKHCLKIISGWLSVVEITVCSFIDRFRTGASPSRKNPKAKQPKKNMRSPGSEKKCVLRPNTPPAFSKQPQELLLLQSKMDANADKTILERVPSTLRAPQHFFQVPDGSMFFLILIFFLRFFRFCY